MQLHDVKAVDRFKNRKRVGRGVGSGMGKTSTRGHKGYWQRSGAHGKVGWEGGSTPLYRRLPKRGFSNFKFKVAFAPINVGQLDRFDGTVGLKELLASGLIRKRDIGAIKILGNGDVKKKLVVEAHAFSASAKEKIEKAGGQCRVLEPAVAESK